MAGSSLFVLHEVENQWLQASSLAPQGCRVGSIGGSDCALEIDNPV